MRTHSTIFLSILVMMIVMGSASCDLINPEEQIPGFIRIDSISINPVSGEGTDMHDIVDAWVYDNEQLVGVYELPAVVPILTTGEANIRIRPGIKLNGQVGVRSVYLFLEDYVGTVEIFEDSVVTINPNLPFKSATEFPWLEEFETPSQITLSSTSLSQENVSIISGEEAFEGNSAKLSLATGQDFFECKSNGEFDLPSAGATVLLEFSYKGNFPLTISMISGNAGGSVQTPIILLSETDEWKHIYVSLTETASTLFQANEHQPVFGFVRNDDSDEELNVYLDNIRLTHF